MKHNKADIKQMKSRNQADSYPNSDLTYKIIGICYKDYNHLGSDYLEKHYQRAIEREARLQKIPFKREAKIDINYAGQSVGKYSLDFVFEGKVALETKKKRFIHRKDAEQLLRYLNALKLKVGLIVNFGGDKIQVKRVVLPDKYLLKSA